MRGAAGRALLLVLLSFALYVNTARNEYALDDQIVNWGNAFVQAGISGLPDLFTHDSFSGFFGKDLKYLAGGRYRPLSQATFALESQLWGKDPHPGHLLNALLYALGVGALFWFLQQHTFQGLPDLAFLSALLFAVHPIHSEAVANLKGRDELLSFLFLVLTLYLALSYERARGAVRYEGAHRAVSHEGTHRAISNERAHRTVGHEGTHRAPGHGERRRGSGQESRKGPLLRAAALGSFGLALLSKENGLTLLGILPAALYAFTPLTFKRIVRSTAPFVLVVVVYLAVRFAVLGPLSAGLSQDVLNDPYVKASFGQKYATIFLTLGKYARLMVLPHPLCWDYSYPAIPYVSFHDPRFWLAMILILAPSAWALPNLRKSPVIAFAILFSVMSIFIVSNLALNIGATMAERLAFQASMGFAILAAAGILFLRARLGRAGHVVTAALVVIVGLACVKTVTRNTAWRGNETLFLTDIEPCLGSSKVNQAAGNELMRRAERTSDGTRKSELLHQAEPYLERAIALYPGFAGALFDLGRLSWLEGDAERAEQTWNQARALSPRDGLLKAYDPMLAAYYQRKGHDAVSGIQGSGHPLTAAQLDRALDFLTRAARYGAVGEGLWYELGLVHFEMQDYPGAVESYRKAIASNPSNPGSWENLGLAYHRMQQEDRAREAWEKALALTPSDPNARRRLEQHLGRGGT